MNDDDDSGFGTLAPDAFFSIKTCKIKGLIPAHRTCQQNKICNHKLEQNHLGICVRKVVSQVEILRKYIFILRSTASPLGV